jgi:D-threo-aldose 1-dehydrogenase
MTTEERRPRVEDVMDNWMRPFGSTGLTVSAVCFGAGPLGAMSETDGATGADVVDAVLSSPIRFLDTSNGYSDGASERRIAAGIAQHGGLPADVVVATKVDASGSDYSGERVRRSVQESKERLGLDELPLVYLHDPEFHDFDMMTERGGAVDALVALRESGEIGRIGLAGGDSLVMKRYLDLGVFEALLTHSRWTLVDRSADGIIAQAHDAGMGIANAAIYGGGALADPRGEAPRYGYRPMTPAIRAAIRRLADVCERWGTDVPTAALQASLREERVHTTVIGFTKAARIDEAMSAIASPLPDEFWAEIDDVLPAPELWLDAGAAR